MLIDEAQSLKPEVLEGLRQLSNLETEKKKLLSFIMVGQPELEERLASRELRQLEQRISVRYILKSLSKTETREYVKHRLLLAADETENITAKPDFTNLAFYLIYRYSKGVPRRINQICDRALMASFNDGRAEVGAWTVYKAAREILR